MQLRRFNALFSLCQQKNKTTKIFRLELFFCHQHVVTRVIISLAKETDLGQPIPNLLSCGGGIEIIGDGSTSHMRALH